MRSAYNDMDYLTKLPVEDRKWLLKFAGEYYFGWFNDQPINYDRLELYKKRHREREDALTPRAPEKALPNFRAEVPFSEDVLISAIDSYARVG